MIDCGDFVEEAEGGTEGTSINNFLGLDVRTCRLILQCIEEDAQKLNIYNSLHADRM